MSKHFIILILAFFSASVLFSQKKPAYNIFTGKGQKSSFSKLLKSSSQADVILFGEYHNNPISHWLELELTKEMFAQDKNLILGAEMIEADQQKILDKYLKNELSDVDFETQLRQWSNYKTDYKPLVEFAKKERLKFIASNIPREYAKMIAKGGFKALDSLSHKFTRFIVPLPIEVDMNLQCYKDMMNMKIHGMGMTKENFVNAQAIKDATMAHFIVKNLETGYKFLHFNGAYHSDRKEGIAHYIQKAKPNLKIVVITTVEQSDLNKLEDENKELADFIIVTDKDMTKTY